MREVFHMALKLDGHSTNSKNPEEIKQAYERLKTLMPNVRVFNADAPREPFLAGDVNLGMLWSGEAKMAQDENPNIHYIYPKEGAGFWIDSFVITSGAENVDNAHKFIDFMLRPEVTKKVVEELGYSTPNKVAKALLEDEILSNPIILPPDEALSKAEFQQDIGDEAVTLMNSYWEKLKTEK
jgi:spermidine/putrescine transport system substrate-binding protein